MTLDTTAELLGTERLLAPRPEPVRSLPEREKIPDGRSRWLAAVSTGKTELDDSNGWYQRAILADAVTPGLNVLRLAVGNLSPVERAATQAFTRHILAFSPDGRMRPFALPADTYTWAAPAWSVLVKVDQRVVTHAGILYRVIQAGDVRVPVGGIGDVMTLPDWRGRGYARAALEKATAFVGTRLWAPFALAICEREHTAFFEAIGWHVVDAPIWCQQPGARVRLANEVAVFLPCQGDRKWPDGPIDVCGAPW